MGIREKAAERVAVRTTAADEAIWAACERAAAAAKVAGTSKVGPVQGGSSTKHYFAITTPMVKARQMLFSVAITGDAPRTVTTTIENYVTSQQKVFGFIPAGPKSMPALRSYRRFMAALETELAAAGAGRTRPTA
jgi:hypothetical protein